MVQTSTLKGFKALRDYQLAPSIKKGTTPKIAEKYGLDKKVFETAIKSADVAVPGFRRKIPLKFGDEAERKRAANKKEVAAQRKADKKAEKEAAKAAEEAQQAAEEALDLDGDRKFDCGKQSLTVGGTGVQIWEGDKFVQSILYMNLQGWTHDEKKNTVEIIVKGEGKKKDTTVKLKSKECAKVTDAMTAKAKEVKSAAKAAKKEKQNLAKELEGEWKVVSESGTLVRESADLDSSKVAVIAFGEVITVDKAEPNFNGSFKTRLRIKESLLKLNNGDEEEVSGWITMKNDQGIDFVKQVGSEDDGDADDAGTESALDLEPEDDPTAEPDPEPEPPSPPPQGNTEFDATQIKKSMYNKKLSMDLKLSVGAMGVTIFDGGMPKDTLKYFELKQWAYDQPTKVLTITRNIEKKSDDRGPANCKFEMKPAHGKAILKAMQDLATENAKQLTADKTAERAAKKELKAKDKAAEEALDLDGDRKFDCGKQSLTVGGTGVQIWEGDKFVQSILYMNLQGWTHDEKKNTVEIIVKGEGKKKDTTVKLKSKECAKVTDAMTAKAKEVKSAAKAAKKEKQNLAKELEGEWKVVSESGTLVRESADLDSSKVAVIAFGEVITVDKAEPNFNGSFKTRLRIKESLLKLNNGDEEEVSGWITMKNDQGIDFVKQVGSEDDGDADDTATHPEPEAEDAEPSSSNASSAPVLYRYKALKAGKVREGSAMDSPILEAGSIEVGEELEVTAREEVGGIMRVQFERGWASVTSKKGSALLDLID